jgi:hypothetical protein
VVALLTLMSACSSDADTATTTTTTAAPATTTTTEPATTTTTSPMFVLEDPPEPLPIEPPDGYELVWNDEFDGDEIDATNWTYDIGGWGWGNGEAQFYTDRIRNARVQDGVLIIEAHFERF